MWSPSVQHVRWANLAGAILWGGTLPVAIVTDWIYSVAFISAASIYANFVSHLSAQRADVPDPEIIERLDRIEKYLTN